MKSLPSGFAKEEDLLKESLHDAFFSADLKDARETLDEVTEKKGFSAIEDFFHEQISEKIPHLHGHIHVLQKMDDKTGKEYPLIRLKQNLTEEEAKKAISEVGNFLKFNEDETETCLFSKLIKEFYVAERSQIEGINLRGQGRALSSNSQSSLEHS